LPSIDYSTVTETPGTRVTDEALSMLLTRYQTAAAFSENKAVLEVACGAGQGLGYLARSARRVIGGDYTAGLLQVARGHYGDRIPLVRLDAHTLPFHSASFDVVILFEALYYLAQPESFLLECRRVLRSDGTLVICTVNREWTGFYPSPLSTRYFSARELRELLTRQGFRVDMYGAFPVAGRGPRDRLVSLIRRVAVLMNLIPKTMRGKEWLKQMFLGSLTRLPPEVSEKMGHPSPLTPVPAGTTISGYKILYAVGRLS
jgi:SAM-dependent methyltransferase